MSENLIMSFSLVRLARSRAFVYSFNIPGRFLWTLVWRYTAVPTGREETVQETNKCDTETNIMFLVLQLP